MWVCFKSMWVDIVGDFWEMLFSSKRVSCLPPLLCLCWDRKKQMQKGNLLVQHKPSAAYIKLLRFLFKVLLIYFYTNTTPQSFCWEKKRELVKEKEVVCLLLQRGSKYCLLLSVFSVLSQTAVCLQSYTTTSGFLFYFIVFSYRVFGASLHWTPFGTTF